MPHPQEVPAYFRALAERGIKTKFTHPREYSRYLNSRTEELRSLEAISVDWFQDPDPLLDCECEFDDLSDIFGLEAA